MTLTKSTVTKIKAGPDDGLAEGQFTGYASVFGNIDSYGDVVIKGAFTKDLGRWEESGDPIPVLYGHNMTDPDFNIGGTIKAAEDDHGLLVTVQLDLDNPKSLQTYRLLKGRRIREMSFAYDVIAGGYAVRPKAGQELADDPETEEYYELRELKLYEVSVVPIGANSETEILDVKALQHYAERLSMPDAGKAGRSISAKNEESLRGAYEAIGAVLATLDTDEEKASADDPSTQSPGTGDAEASQPVSVAPESLDLLALELDAAAV